MNEDFQRSVDLRPGGFDGTPREKARGYDPMAVGIIEDFIGKLDKGAKVVEVGMGAGIEAAQMKGRGLNVVGVDLSEKMIGLAKEHSQNSDVSLDVARADAFHLPFADGSQDAVVCKDLLTRAGRYERLILINEMRRVLKDGGKMLLIGEEIPETQMVVDGHLLSGKLKYLQKLFEEGQNSRMHSLEFTQESLGEEIQEARGLKINELETRKSFFSDIGLFRRRWGGKRLVYAVAEKVESSS